MQAPEDHWYDLLIDLLTALAGKPAVKGIISDVLERHGESGLLTLVGDDSPEIEEEEAAIESLFGDMIDPDELSRELSSGSE